MNFFIEKHVLIMDEVDGMSGNEDRGGVQELISLIKSSKVPVICICNDRNHPKIRSLANYCFDLRYSTDLFYEEMTNSHFTIIITKHAHAIYLGSASQQMCS